MCKPRSGRRGSASSAIFGVSFGARTTNESEIMDLALIFVVGTSKIGKELVKQ